MKLTNTPPARAVYVLDSDVTQNSITNTVLTEQVASRFTIPANTMSASSALRLTYFGHVLNNSGSPKDMRIRVVIGTVGGAGLSTTAGSVTPLDTTHAAIPTNANERAIEGHCFIASANSNTLNSALGSDRMGSPDTINGVATDTAVGEDKMCQYFSFTYDHAVAKDLTLTVQYTSTVATARYTAHIAILELIV